MMIELHPVSLFPCCEQGVAYFLGITKQIKQHGKEN